MRWRRCNVGGSRMEVWKRMNEERREWGKKREMVVGDGVERRKGKGDVDERGE